jgi:hypothetical protein
LCHEGGWWPIGPLGEKEEIKFVHGAQNPVFNLCKKVWTACLASKTPANDGQVRGIDGQSNLAAYAQLFRFVNTYFVPPTGPLVVLEIGCGWGRNVCCFPLLAAKPTIMLAIEPHSLKYNQAATAVNNCRINERLQGHEVSLIP